MYMSKVLESRNFGNSVLIDYLLTQGAEYENAIRLSVPPDALRSALEKAKELGLNDQDVEFLESELANKENYADEDMVDLYDLW